MAEFVLFYTMVTSFIVWILMIHVLFDIYKLTIKGGKSEATKMTITLPESANVILKRFMWEERIVFYTIDDECNREDIFHGGIYDSLSILIHEKKPLYMYSLNKHPLFWYYGVNVNYVDKNIVINVITADGIIDGYEELKTVVPSETDIHNANLSKVMNAI